ncbi:MAG: winged helix-turn-helix transcriptional regulator [Dehalococcoidia bacterium]|nr:winged helix-turn-helix transcriptional regulator [Dehalococcoidia bacterium]MXY44223.1 winged helix-turn-helix transcriptional regulator [Dehalococcoidia bacterium]
MTDPQQQWQQSLDRWTEDPTTNLGTFIADLFNALDKAMAREVAPHGITGLEYSLLWHCMEGECTATQLAQVLPVDGSRISRVVTGLVDKGFLRRRRLRTDRRIVMLRLTEKGMELTSGISQNMQRYYAMLTEGIGEEEMRVFASVTSRIVANHAVTQWPE